jgi:Ser/Thr protein kinase RdoA (MazF antagonist)
LGDAGAALGSSGSARLSSWSAPGSTPLESGSACHGVPTPTPVEATPSEAPVRSARARFEAGELATVCSHYDVGVIESIKEFRRGSGRAPKVVLKTERGRFLLKRRAAGNDAATRVAFCHAVQLFLSKRQFPLPKLVRTRTDHKTTLVRDGFIYELFEFVDGDHYDMSLDATADAGRALALFHRLLTSFHLHGYRPPSGGFHGAPGLKQHLELAGQRLSGGAAEVVERLAAAYDEASRRAEEQGFSGWPTHIVHGDWHPGNMLFRGSRVAAVIDYDTARLCPRALDIANGVLQFSITMRGSDPQRWPVGLDEGRFKRFLRGYETVPGSVISVAELDALPWLMIEALIVEAVVPIAATGSFAGLCGASFLRTVDANVAWIHEYSMRLSGLLSE